MNQAQKRKYLRKKIHHELRKNIICISRIVADASADEIHGYDRNDNHYTHLTNFRESELAGQIKAIAKHNSRCKKHQFAIAEVSFTGHGDHMRLEPGFCGLFVKSTSPRMDAYNCLFGDHNG